MRANTGGGSKKSVNPNNGTNGRNGPKPEDLTGSSATRAEIETRARVAHNTMILEQQRLAAENARRQQEAQARAARAEAEASKSNMTRAREAFESSESEGAGSAEDVDDHILNTQEEEEKPNGLTFSQRMIGSLTEEEKELPRSKRKKILIRRRAIRVVIAMIMVACLAIGVKLIIDRWVNPKVDYVADLSVSGAGALESWSLALNGADTESIKGIVPESFLAQEEKYTYTSEQRTAFIGTALSTVSYELPVVERKNVFGEVITKDENDVPVTVTGTSDLMNGESVKLSYIDYSAIPVDAETLKAFVEAEKFNVKDPDVAEKLTDLYAKYINSLKKSDTGVPVKTIDWTPAFDTHEVKNSDGKNVEGLVVSLEEDIALDNLLFATNEFWLSQYEFSKNILGGDGSKEYQQWVGFTKKSEETAAAAKLAAEEKAAKDKADAEAKVAADKLAKEEKAAAEKAKKEGKPVPTPAAVESAVPSEGATAGATATPSAEATVGAIEETISAEKKESEFLPGMESNELHTTARPAVGNTKFIDPLWIGAYYLQTGRIEFAKSFDVEVKPVVAPVGLGVRDNTAGLNASILTTQIDSVKGKDVKTPIRVQMLTILRDQEAINYFQSKDTRNRGFLSDSQVKYIATSYKVTNLGTEEISIRDNSTLSDDQVNITGTTGNVFGLTTAVKLKPGESGVVESWAASPTLEKSFIIWGKDFSRRAEVVWFRQLAAKDGSVSQQEGIDDAPEIAPESTDTPVGEGGLEEVVPLDEIPVETKAPSVAPTKAAVTGGSTEDDGS